MTLSNASFSPSDGTSPNFRSRRSANHDAAYSKATMTSRNRIPVQREADSRTPPIIAPKRLDPSASPRKPSMAKLRINTMPAKNTRSEERRVGKEGRYRRKPYHEKQKT